jgi:transposase
MARPSKATAEVVAQLEAELQAGTTIKQAAFHVGVSESTLRAWLDKGVVTRRQLKAVPDPESVREAGISDERLEAAAVEALIRAFRADWRSAAWFLERAFPGRWGKTT